jgi:dinuclear metal center YbgI/SA1388 family protein
MPTLADIARHLDDLLLTDDIPDYANALNGVQLANRREIRRVAAAVDFSLRTVEGTLAAEANLLVVHHGMFWGGLQPIRGSYYERLQPLLANDVAVYASHLPLDMHAKFGNNVLLARELGLHPSGGFARHENVTIGVRGETDIATDALVDGARRFAQGNGGTVVATRYPPGRRTRRWAICTGAGASADTLQEAAAEGIDTLIVGEGPHWTAVAAEEARLVIVYAGHYATETLGVRALAAEVERAFGVPWTFIAAPTGL